MALNRSGHALACGTFVTAVVVLVTPRDLRGQALSPAAAPWSGQAQCVVVGKTADYLDEQTHTWRLTGDAPTPAPRGSAQVYYSWPAVWSVEGGGRKTIASPTSVATARAERWTIASEMPATLRVTEIAGRPMRVRIGADGQRGAPLGSIRVTEVSGRTRDASVQPWTFPAIEDDAANDTVSGTSTRTYAEGFGVGWAQPPKAVTTATCTWSFTRGGVGQSRAKPPAQISVAGRGSSPSGIAAPTLSGGRGPASVRGIDANSAGTGAAINADGAAPTGVAARRAGGDGTAVSGSQPDGATAGLGTAVTGGALGAFACAQLPPPPFSATPGSVTFQLTRPAGTIGYRIARRDLGDLTSSPVTDASFTHIAPLGHWMTYEYTFTGVLADGGCSSTTAMVRPPAPLTPQVTAAVTLGNGQQNRVALSWGAQSDRPTSYVVIGRGVPATGAEVPASTNAASYRFDIVNLSPGTYTWEVLPLWKTPTGNMSDVNTDGRVTVTIHAMTVGPSMARTIDLPGFTGSGGRMHVGPRTIDVAGFRGAGTAYVGPRTISPEGWTANGPFAPIQGVVK
jgi:hypothetical protein